MKLALARLCCPTARMVWIPGLADEGTELLITNTPVPEVVVGPAASGRPSQVTVMGSYPSKPAPEMVRLCPAGPLAGATVSTGTVKTSAVGVSRQHCPGLPPVARRLPSASRTVASWSRGMVIG